MRLALIQPIVLFMFAAAIGGLWAWRQHNAAIAALALGFALFGAGLLVQLTQMPAGITPNAVISAAFYCAGTLALAQGFLLRANKRSGRPLLVAMAAAILVAIWYYSWIDEQLLVRIYVLNFGMGAMFLVTAWLSRHMARGSTTDKAMFWVLVVLGVHFFPRILLTAGSVGRSVPAEFAQTNFWTSTIFAFGILGVAVGLTVIIVTMADMVRAMQQERDTDALTGIANRRGLELGAAELLEAPGAAPVSLILCDLDNFKAVNDRYGHEAGDLVLKTFAETLKANTRSGDLVARLGGEEFVVLLPGLDAEQGYALAERLRLAAANADLDQVAHDLSVTCSLGVVQVKGGESFADALFRADEQVYAAKHNGRNRTYAEGIGPAGRQPRLRKL